MSDNNNVKVNETIEETAEITAPAEVKAGGRLTPEYIMEQIEKLVAESEHIRSTALGVLSEDTTQAPNAPGAPEDIAGSAKFAAIADVVKCRETTIQQVLSFYREKYEEVKPSPMDIALAQAERVLSAPVFAQSISPELKDERARKMFEDIIKAFTESLQDVDVRSQHDKDSSKPFKAQIVERYINSTDEYMSPQQLAEYLALLDN